MMTKAGRKSPTRYTAQRFSSNCHYLYKCNPWHGMNMQCNPGHNIAAHAESGVGFRRTQPVIFMNTNKQEMMYFLGC